MIHRSAVFAGSFYPSEPHRLAKGVLTFLEDARVERISVGLKALVVPHAGYVYSGAIAGSAYSLLRHSNVFVKQVVILGPSHRFAFQGLGLPLEDIWSTPLGDVAISAPLKQVAVQYSQVSVQPKAHLQEHSLEVQLPFLQVTCPDASILPIVVGDCNPSQVADVLEALWRDSQPLLVVSTDLSHYLPNDLARSVDQETANMIVSRQSVIQPDQACGSHALNGLLCLAQRMGWSAQLLDLRNSSDTAGDDCQVVGYGAFSFE